MNKYFYSSDSFYTDSYGAHRWEPALITRPGTWRVVTMNLEFDRMRGIDNDVINMTCVVDDFGSLVKVPA
jgi:hypothetical protein